MATVTVLTREESQRRVRSPLERLRGYIRWYVAAEAVEKVPVAEVFDWHRLQRLVVRGTVLWIGMFFLVGALYCAFEALKPAAWAAKSGRDGLADYPGRFTDVTAIWFERNILLW